MSMKDKIYETIDKIDGGVSFVELMNHIPESKGDFEFGFKEKNIVLWSDLSEEFLIAIQTLHDEQKIIMCLSSYLVYACDGGMLNLPISKQSIKYKKPHWLPVVFWSDRQAKRDRILVDACVDINP
jgi:hypothetical protein